MAPYRDRGNSCLAICVVERLVMTFDASPCACVIKLDLKFVGPADCWARLANTYQMDPVKKKPNSLWGPKRGKAKRVNRTEDLQRRQRKDPLHCYLDVLRSSSVTKTWLETHIWHAKRMKMVDIWGYRLVCD